MRSAGRTSQRTFAGSPAGPIVWTVPWGMSKDSPAGTVLCSWPTRSAIEPSRTSKCSSWDGW